MVHLANVKVPRNKINRQISIIKMTLHISVLQPIYSMKDEVIPGSYLYLYLLFIEKDIYKMY